MYFSTAQYVNFLSEKNNHHSFLLESSANHVIDRQEILGDETDLNLSDDDENEVVNEENQNEIIPHSNSEAENDDELNPTVRGNFLSILLLLYSSLA